MEYMQEYQSWLTRFAQDEQTVRELQAIKNDPKEIEDRFYRELSFGTAGMRGVLGAGANRMNRYNVRRATAGFAEFLKRIPGAAERGVAIGYDSRRYSDVFALDTALVLAARGVKSYLFDALRPVPLLSFAVRHLNAAAGVVITASHNPPQYNGYKVYFEDGAQLSPEMADGVTEEIRKLRYEDCVDLNEEQALKQGLLKYIGNKEVDDAYIQMVLGLLVRPDLVQKEGSRLSIVYTPLHGSGNVPVRRALKEAGFEKVVIVAEQEKPDPDFPTVKAPNPEDPNAFALAIPLAEQCGATMIFGTDPDCDRLGVCVKDGQGVFRTLTGNQIGCLMLYHILSQKKQMGKLPANGACCKSIVSTELARAICEDFGVSLYDTLTGFKFIGEKIQQFEETGSHSFLFGFEESFGYLSSTRVRDKDGVNASLLISEAACVCLNEGITLYERLQEIFKRYGYFEEQVLSLSFPGREGADKMAGIMKSLRQNPPKSIAGLKIKAVRDYLTGVRTDADGAKPMGQPESDVLYYEMENRNWFCVRPSGTEPKIKLYISANAPQSAEAALDLAKAMMKEASALFD